MFVSTPAGAKGIKFLWLSIHSYVHLSLCLSAEPAFTQLTDQLASWPSTYCLSVYAVIIHYIIWEYIDRMDIKLAM